MGSDTPNEAGMAMLEAVENQLESNDPPKTRETLNRLMAEGIERDQALKYIACALSIEVFGALKLRNHSTLNVMTKIWMVYRKCPGMTTVET